MKGAIASFRGSHKRKSPNQMIVVIDGIENREKAQALVGKGVKWIAPGKTKKELAGKVSGAHGKKGAVRVTFDTGMPGQSLGEQVLIE